MNEEPVHLTLGEVEALENIIDQAAWEESKRVRPDADAESLIKKLSLLAARTARSRIENGEPW